MIDRRAVARFLGGPWHGWGMYLAVQVRPVDGWPCVLVVWCLAADPAVP